MKAAQTWVLGCTVFALSLVFALPTTSLATEPITTIGTGGINGVYYSVGGAIAKMFNLKRQEFGGWMANQATKGSVKNIEAVLDGEFDFGIAQGNFLFDAVNGEGLYAGQMKGDLCAVLGLYIEDITIVAAVDAEINTAADLKGKRVNIGVPGSSAALTAQMVLQELGIAPEDLKLFNYPNYEVSERLQSGDIDAYIFTVGHPNLLLMEATNGQRKVQIVPLPKILIDDIAARKPYLFANKINPEYYDRLANKGVIPSVGVKAMLFTRADMDEKMVYQVVKQVMDNLELFRQQHPALANLTRSDLSINDVIPLHPGAERYFRATGLVQ
jgi:TRAP transporter TAXI family solute receptor